MADAIKGRHLLKAKDFVDVVGPDGEALPSVPKHWGEDQLAPGASFKKKSSSSSSGSTSNSSPANPDAPPAGNAGTDAWVEWAKRVKGATDEDLTDAGGEPLKRDEIKAKYAETPAS